MGSGFVAACNEASAIYYNPAALARLGHIAIAGNLFELLPQLSSDKYYHLAGAVSTGLADDLRIGAAFTYLDYGTYIITSEEGPDDFEEIKLYEWGISLASAARLGQRTNIGLGVKYVRSTTGLFLEAGQNASAIAIDLGFLYDGFLPGAHFSKQFLGNPLPWSKWAHSGLRPGFSLGVVLANIGPQIGYTNGAMKLPLPQTLRIGLAWNLLESDVVAWRQRLSSASFLLNSTTMARRTAR